MTIDSSFNSPLKHSYKGLRRAHERSENRVLKASKKEHQKPLSRLTGFKQISRGGDLPVVTEESPALCVASLLTGVRSIFWRESPIFEGQLYTLSPSMRTAIAQQTMQKH